MAGVEEQSVFLRIAALSAEALAPGGAVYTTAFLAACSEVLPIVEKLGTAFAMVRMDVNGNITRLKDCQAVDPAKYAELFPIALDEVASGEACGSRSATKGILWLKRAMEFVTALLQRLRDNRGETLPAAASEAYTETLYKYHGWVTSAAFTVALKLAPSRETFFQQFDLPPGADLMEQMQTCLKAFCPVLAAVQTFLAEHDLDDPTRL
mmetsp:Transcript_19346/g.58475  ORF Transcript_19346/g.58475 Transcript_19346/m.58475 type:complete len:209 (+) Transcript_19346:161-787(+)|eukprot:CAMPEP_0206145418 /NCGR_PEP_ID=MMETSP1473-20131121/27281_1 /ASSEMBLY_ACC=CAM_ASM_001109 /TAXON_ID=1461547 /ORGANISM="Stichococcus sp, Strain RCC1054" /LENGTH=208 /DNA_ID=CAMNT_0053541619 /DNA_START=62 /DNA_END=688 /DNA_ORIENTATION=-